MNWQQLIVIFIGIIVGAAVIYRLYRLFFGKKDAVRHGCKGCGGCDLKI
jgi:hypothetical protein